MLVYATLYTTYQKVIVHKQNTFEFIVFPLIVLTNVFIILIHVLIEKNKTVLRVWELVCYCKVYLISRFTLRYIKVYHFEWVAKMYR